MKSFLKQINESFQALDEKAAKPDFLDLDKDGDTEEPMKKAAKEKNEAVDQDKDGDNDFDDVKIARMMASGMSKEDALKKVREEKELEEISVTGGLDGGAGPPRTPYAFSKKEKKKMKYPGVAEAMDRKYEQLIEGYKQFALGEKNSSPSKTVNSAIREVAKQLKSIEETVKYTSRLKTESGISHSGFSSGTHNALRKISERLVKISERVRSLGE
jgi:uncharacterized iron-regulated protein|tara:strand:+ start:16 stop:660 length:645 start_codon:yes stop_codon:yes gene_type:complete